MPRAKLTDKEFYKLADIVIKELNAVAIKRFKKLQRQVSMLDIDELNVFKNTKATYNLLESDNIKAFVGLAGAVYYDISKKRKKKRKKDDDSFWEDWLLLHILNKVDPVTQYIYTNEVKRKQERTAEALIATLSTKKPKGSTKRSEINKALRYWSLQSTQYCDIITDAVSLEAYKDMGVEYVQWNTQEDERVCEKCAPLDKKVYRIDKVPPKQHYRCRCWLSSVDSNKSKS